MTTVRPLVPLVGLLCALCIGAAARAANFTRDAAEAKKFGVHEIQLQATALPADAAPLDLPLAVRFTPPEGPAVTVQAFHLGDRQWAARVYVSATGGWRWQAEVPAGMRLARTEGTFRASTSALRGRLLRHPANPSQWMTEDGRWFLNLNDTAYFLFAPRDTRGEPIDDATSQAYAREAAAQGITSLRAFLVWGEAAKWNDDQVWSDTYFSDPVRGELALAHFTRTDRRLTWLLDEHPDLYLQLIMVPRGSRHGADETHWHTFPAATKERLLRHLVARYAAFPQVFWLAVNDAHYGEKFPRNEALAREIGLYLQRYDPWQHPYSTGAARMVEVPFAAEPWLTYVHLERRWDLAAAGIERYRSTGKPVFLGEDYYEQDRPANNPVDMPYFQRRLFWSWLLAGGSANYGGRWSSLHPYRSVSPRQPYAPYPKYEPTYTQGLTGLDSVPHLARFFAQRRTGLIEFVPADALVRTPDPTTPAGRPKALRRGAVEYLVYHPNAATDGKAAAPRRDVPARLTVDLSEAAGLFHVQWYNPATGDSYPMPLVKAPATVTLTAPWTGGDAVLHLAAPPRGDGLQGTPR